MSTPPSQPARPTPEKIFSAMNAHQLSFALRGAIELDIFTAIAEGNNEAAALAKRVNATERGCRILCDFLTLQGLLTKQDGKWALTPDSAAFLDRRSPMYLGDTAHFLHDASMLSYQTDVAEMVRRGGTVATDGGTVKPDNPLWVSFARHMATMMRPGSIELAQILGSGDGAHWKVLDVAAGHGLFGIAIAQSNPNAHIVALDWAAVLEVARENAVAAGVADRLSTIAGSAFDADLGSGYDYVLLTNFLHHFDPETNTGLLKRVHAALKPGGKAVTVEFVPNEDRITPPTQAGFAMTMLASTKGGDAFTFAEYESMFRGAGFAATEMIDMKYSPQRVLISQK